MSTQTAPAFRIHQDEHGGTYQIEHPTLPRSLRVTLCESGRYNPQPGRTFVQYVITEGPTDHAAARSILLAGSDYSPAGRDPFGPPFDLLALAFAPFDGESGAEPNEDERHPIARLFAAGIAQGYDDERATLEEEHANPVRFQILDAHGDPTETCRAATHDEAQDMRADLYEQGYSSTAPTEEEEEQEEADEAWTFYRDMNAGMALSNESGEGYVSLTEHDAGGYNWGKASPGYLATLGEPIPASVARRAFPRLFERMEHDRQYAP